MRKIEDSGPLLLQSDRSQVLGAVKVKVVTLYITYLVSTDLLQEPSPIPIASSIGSDPSNAPDDQNNVPPLSKKTTRGRSVNLPKKHRLAKLIESITLLLRHKILR